jgi:hypothetical protein
MSSLPQTCHEKTRLLNEYRRATDLYSAAVRELSRKIGIVERSAYMSLNDDAENGRRLSGDARDQLERHVAQHGC